MIIVPLKKVLKRKKRTEIDLYHFQVKVLEKQQKTKNLD
jgi:hypothetical protein